MAKTIAKKESPKPEPPDLGDGGRKRLCCGVGFGGLQAGEELNDDLRDWATAGFKVRNLTRGDAQGLGCLGLRPP